MDWFEMRVGFHGDPKCLGLRARLGNPCAEVYVSRIYAYCYQQEQDRFEGDGAAGILERAAEWRGRTGRLVAALLAEGFIDREDGALVVHGVSKRLEAALKRRSDGLARWHRHSNQRVANALATEQQRVANAQPNQPTNQEEDLSAGAPPAAAKGEGEKRVAKPKAEKPAASDPRHGAIRNMLPRVYAELRGAGDFPWGAPQAGALSRLLKSIPDATVDEFERRWRRALHLRAYPGTADALQFFQRWASLAAPSGTPEDFRSQIDSTRKAANEF